MEGKEILACKFPNQANDSDIINYIQESLSETPPNTFQDLFKKQQILIWSAIIQNLGCC